MDPIATEAGVEAMAGGAAVALVGFAVMAVMILFAAFVKWMQQ